MGYCLAYYNILLLVAREQAIPWVIVGQSTRIQDRVTSALIFSAQMYSSSAVLLQFWEVINTKSGEKKLKLSEQPFGLGNLYNGLCRYKYHCMQQEYEDDHGQNGPPSRVLKRGLREDCPTIMQYSTEEFPSRDYAMECGIVSYWALPLFGSGATQVLGVLECFSMKSYDYFGHEYPVLSAAKESDLLFCSPHYHECHKIRRYKICPRIDIKKALKVVREAHQLPLIQVWVPCICGDTNHKPISMDSNKLFCDMRICGENLKCLLEFKTFKSKFKTSFVKGKEGLVGSAYSENRPCFFSDTSQLSMSDSPFALWTRSAGLTACFVVPLKLVHSMLDDLFLEMFLPPQGTGTNEASAVLKSLLSTVAQEFAKLYIPAGLKQDEEFLAEFSHLGREKFEFSFFHVKRITEGEAENTCKHANDSSGEVIATMAEDQITLDVLKPYFGITIDAAAEDLGVSRSTLKRKCRALGIKRWPRHKRNKVTNTQSNARLKQSESQKNTTKKRAPHSQFQTKDSATDREAAADSVPSSSRGDRIHENYDMIGKATYGDDTIMFPLKSNGGIKELHKELNQRFQLQADKFKIKYRYEEDWILIICDQDLNFGMEMIKSTGENTINLSIFPLSIP